jgi:hypothetical protein
MGANSYSTYEGKHIVEDLNHIESFTHSTGHGMITSLIKTVKETNKKPKVVFIVTTDKQSETISNQENDKSEKFEPSFEKKEGLNFRKFSKNELIKKRRFFAYSDEIRIALKDEVEEDIMIYNPKEEVISGCCADILITEKGVLSRGHKECEEDDR